MIELNDDSYQVFNEAAATYVGSIINDEDDPEFDKELLKLISKIYNNESLIKHIKSINNKWIFNVIRRINDDNRECDEYFHKSYGKYPEHKEEEDKHKNNFEEIVACIKKMKKPKKKRK